MMKTYIKCDSALTPADCAVAWSILLKEHNCSQNVMFLLSEKDALCADFEQARPITVELIEEQTVEGLCVQIDEQRSHILPTQLLLESGSIQSHLWILHGKDDEADPVLPATLDDNVQSGLSVDLDIVCRLFNNGFTVEISTISRCESIRNEGETRISRQLVHMIQQLAVPEARSVPLSHMETASEFDKQAIWNWNSKLLDPDPRNAVSMFSEKVLHNSDALAISAWDGDFKYRDVDHLSNVLALVLKRSGVGKGDIIPLHFEKSKWTPIAVVAVIKTGAAFVLLDEDLPVKRLGELFRLTSQTATVVLTSASQKQRLGSLVTDRELLVIDHCFFLDHDSQSTASLKLPTIAPADPIYVVFTSGTTGVPKGATILHSNICSFASLVGDASAVDKDSRILSLAAYAYDVSLGNMFLALLTGSCLCIPSSWECKNDVPRLVENFKVTHVQTTPSISKLFDSKQSSSLAVLDLCGEPCSEDALARWRGTDVRVMNTYSPAECTITSVLNRNVLASSKPSIIGRALGACWITNPANSQRLTPIGGVGELLIEGPLVGAGYFNDPERTKSVFIENPMWLVDGFPGISTGRQGRLYRTGDLARYTSDGEIEILGRQDSQVKIRGQRVELGEVSTYLQLFMPAWIQFCPEVVTTMGDTERLVVFFVVLGDMLRTLSTIREVVCTVHAKMKEALPRSMLPSAYAFIDCIPLSMTGKTDHCKLKELAKSIPADRLFFPEAEAGLKAPQSINVDDLDSKNNEEKLEKLRCAWAEVLHVDQDLIGNEDTFFNLGGESLAAMKLVSIAARSGINIDFATVFRFPKLVDMAARLTYSVRLSEHYIQPFSLLGPKQSLEDLAVQCSTTVDNIEDVYPCTALQEGLVLSGTQSSQATYMGRQVLTLSCSIDIERLVCAWKRVIATHAVLRTRIVDSVSNGFLQVVLKEDDTFVEDSNTDLALYISRDDGAMMHFGDRLIRWTIVRELCATHFVLTLHHALYDGWTLPRLGAELHKAYMGQQPRPSLAYNVFISHTRNLPRKQGEEYWANCLSGPSMPSIFPALPSSILSPLADSSFSKSYETPRNNHDNLSLPSLLRAAWAVLVGQLVGTDDVMFGSIVSGRDVPLPGLEDLLAPTISTVPVRVTINNDVHVGTFLQTLQDQSLEMMPFEHLGLQAIRGVNNATRLGSQFQTLFIVQPPSEEDIFTPSQTLTQGEHDLGELLKSLDLSSSLQNFNEYALMIIFKQKQHTLDLEFSFDSRVLNISEIRRLSDQLIHVLTQLCHSRSLDCRLSDLDLTMVDDIETIWQWNGPQLTERSHEFVHEVIIRTMTARSDNWAVQAWDGNISYRQLDNLSTKLAKVLQSKGVGPGCLVPICVEKSFWVSVAMIGILRAGAGFVAMDVRRQPLQRLQTIVRESGADHVVTAGPAAAIACELSLTVINCDLLKDYTSCSLEKQLVSRTMLVLPEDCPSSDESTSSDPFSRSGSPITPDLRDSCSFILSASDTAFVVFTSGSTGIPKGIRISHDAFCTTIGYHRDALGLCESSRVYDFASYSFDIAVHNCLMTLALGGCLCVPSELDRENDIEGSLQRLDSNWANLTPSIARIIEPSKVPALKTLILSGESVGKELILQWAESVRLINAYGPAECQICTVYDNLIRPGDAYKIGRGVACATWIVNPRSEKLVPIGAVGELVIEGPILSSGYINTPPEGFVRDPSWLLQGSNGFSGRTGMVYRTGDLARYLTDGTMVYAGRITAQTKIRGQRVELGEIEFHLQTCLPELGNVVVDMITTEGVDLLCAFVTATSDLSAPSDQPSTIDTSGGPFVSLDAPRDLKQLKQGLPAFMIPSTFFKVSHIPLTATGKVDRRKLRQAASKFEKRDLLHSGNPGMELHLTSSLLEKLKRVWSNVLGLDPAFITPQSDFFELKGDSISAMRLVQACRTINISLTVTDIFRHSRLHELCDVAVSLGDEINKAAEPSSSSERNTKRIAPFSMLTSDDIYSMVEAVATACSVEPHRVLDAYPCTPFQEALFAHTASNGSAYVQHLVLKFDENHCLHRVLEAWDSVIASNIILRTRVVQSESTELFQVVIRELQDWPRYKSTSQYLEEFESRPVTFGSALSRFAVIRTAGRFSIVWTMHHAVYDSWTTRLILQQFSDHLSGRSFEMDFINYGEFLKYLIEQEDTSRQWWRSCLSGASQATPFPKTSLSDAREGISTSKTSRDIRFPTEISSGWTPAELIRCAWAIITSRQTGCERVLFGETHVGRNISLPGIEELRGPTVASVPVLVDVRPDQTVASLSMKMREQWTQMQAFEHFGLQNISRLSDDCKAACNFQTLLVVQDGSELFSSSKYVFEVDESIDDIRNFNSYHLTIVFTKNQNSLHAEALFHDHVVSAYFVDELLQQLEVLLWSLSELREGISVAELNVATAGDLQRIWRWNAEAPAAFIRTMDSLVTEQAVRRPDEVAILAHDGKLTYQELETMSSLLAQRLSSNGIGPGCFVPLVFEKSMWVPVAMMAVLKTGAAFSVLDVSHPEDRLRQITTLLKARLVLCSGKSYDLACKISDSAIVLDNMDDKTDQLQPRPVDSSRILNASNIMYVCFTSGSTGTPKGVMVSHQSLASAAVPQTRYFGFGPGQRVYDFSSHAFDAHVWHTWWSLISGACLCIPSDEDRLTNLAGSIDYFQSTMGFLTPSVARTISPQDVPTMKKLFLGGEAVTPWDVSLWAGHLELWGGYGPTEATPVSLFSRLSRPDLASNIGRPIGVVAWICDPDNCHNLVAIGAVGELVLEGPPVTLGYYGDADRTSQVFLESPGFMRKRRSGRVYRTGDLVRYSTDGSIQYLGRADSQVKLRGQRVEFGEIEYHLKRLIPDAASAICEIVTHESGRQMLVAFYSFADDRLALDETNILNMLGRALPSYMIPEALLATDSIPRNSSGKLDRLRLRTMAPDILRVRSLKTRCSTSPTVHRQFTEAEVNLKRMWSVCLHISESTINPESHFFEEGGDSIAAMKLSNLARRQDLSLSVQAIMKSPQLCDMAKITSPYGVHNRPYRAFSLMDHTKVESLLAEASTLCSTPITSIKDLYPCSPLQTELFALTLKQPHAYVRQAVYEIPRGIGIAELVRAWDAVVAAHPILRTRFIDVEGLGLLQVVLEDHTWDNSTSLSEYIDTVRSQQTDFGSPLSRLAVIDDMSSPKLVWTVHHSLYDGWSTQILEEDLRRAYHGIAIQNGTSYSCFIRHVISLDVQAARKFWKFRLEGCGENTALFPSLPSKYEGSQPGRSQTFKRTLNCKVERSKGVQSIIHVAWALVVAQVTERDDVVFAATLAGRDAPVHGIETVVGPTIAPVPIRIRLDKSQTKTVQQLLDDIDAHAFELAPYQHFGTRNIEAINDDTNAACQFRTLVVVTPTRTVFNGDSEITNPRIATFEDDESQGSFHTFPLVLFLDPGKDDIALEVVYDPLVLEERVVRRLSSRLERAILALNEVDCPFGEVDLLCEDDIHDVHRWNSPSPTPSDQLLHQVILQSAHDHPQRLAIDAWDGRLLYAELETFSRALGRELRFNCGIGNGAIIPILSFKSRYVAVAAVAVLRIGATILPLDASWPVARLEAIITQVQPSILLATEASREQARALGVPIVFIADFCSEAGVEEAEAPADTETNPTPGDVACILFTSGSTGEPKGVMQTHMALVSAIISQASSSGFTTDTRAFEFASYAFDVSWNMIFKVLALGATLCVPSEEDRLNDLVGSLNRFGATLTELTPSVASLISGPALVPTLRILILSGEPVNLREFRQWKDHVQLIVCYGPSECTSVSTINTTGEGCGIGKPQGCLTWIMNPEDHRRLVPVGVVGEILIEGPLVGRGYYGNDALTAASYVSEIPLRASASKHWEALKCGRRAFKSGDLARYDFDGNLHFVARKDTQAKLRGQRVELGDIQNHICAAFPHGLLGSAVCCIVAAHNTGSEQRLVAFLRSDAVSPLGLHCELVEPSGDLALALETMDGKLGACLPRYMLPSAYFFVNTIPHTVNGKVDRRILALLASQASPGQTYHGRPRCLPLKQGNLRRVTGYRELKIQKWWAALLQRKPESIASSDNFFEIGGDSISAMRLVGLARREGFGLSVSDVFLNATLSELAEKVEISQGCITRAVTDDVLAPFSLLGDSIDIPVTRAQIGAACKLDDASTVEDAYPCTPLQQSMLAATVRDPGAFVSMRPYRIPLDVDFSRLREAWDTVIQRHSILRTRLVDLIAHGLTQVVIREQAPWTSYSSMAAFLEQSAFITSSMGHGTPLMHLALIRDPAQLQLVWIIHHAIYDGWVLPMLEEEIKMSYLDKPLEAPYPGMRPIVKYLRDANKDDSISFWKKELQSDGDCITSFPLLPSSTYLPKPVSCFEKKIPAVAMASDRTMSEFLYCTWSLLVSRLTGGNRVNFGAILTGRNAPVHNIHRIMGPTITTVPIVVNVDWSTTLAEFRAYLRNKTVGMIPHEHIGIQSIRRIEGIEAATCDFQTVLVIQPPPSPTHCENNPLSKLVLMEDMDETSIPGFPDQHGVLNSYGLMMEIVPNTTGEITVRASFDGHLVSPTQMDRMISQWSHLMQQLSDPMRSETPLNTLDFVCSEDLDDIWAWNERVPAKIDRFIHDIVTEVASLQPFALALDSWEGQMTYHDLDIASTNLARRLVYHGVGPGHFVPLLFQKSLWANVSMLAVLKTGGAFVPLDADHPEGHLRSIMQALNARTILCSASTRDRAARLAPHTILVDANTRGIDAKLNTDHDFEDINLQERQTLQADSIAYAVFTSGSTGAAKGVKISHTNLTTAIHYQAGERGYELCQQTRSLDSSSYSFDACVCNFFYTIAKGGCLCVPSDESLKGDIAAFMREYRVNWAQLVPSVARTVDSRALPELKRLVLTGEPMTRGDIDTWGSRLELINAYGPTECTILCAISSPLKVDLVPGSRVGEVGRGRGANLWLTELGNPGRLAPVGAVGEVLIEGPLIGLGYLGPYEYPLCVDPHWLLQGTGAIPGRRGTLFRTGDQARYDDNGNLIFVGRIGSEIKIRGQRVDLMGIEDAVRCTGTISGIEVAAAIVSLSSDHTNKKQTLLLFASDATLPVQGSMASLEGRLRMLAPSLKTALDNALPNYLQPEAFAILPTMPKTSSGKTDRRRLGEIGKNTRLQELVWISGHAAKTSLISTAPITPQERMLAEVWAEVLAIQYHTINNDDDFFQLGGDSLGVMRLITLANARGSLLKPAAVFSHPILKDLAKRMVLPNRSTTQAAEDCKVCKPFCLAQDLFRSTSAFIQDFVVPQLGITAAEVEDIVPANGFQIDYIHNIEEPLGLQFAYLDIGPNVSWQQLTEACRDVVQSFQCLRARFIEHEGRYYQVILREAPLTTETIVSDEQVTLFSTQFCPENAQRAKINDVMTQLTLASFPNQERRRAILRMSHMQNDGWCTIRILKAIELAYNGRTIAPTPSWTSLLHCREQNADASRRYWQNLLQGSQGVTEPFTFTPQASSPAVQAIPKVRTLRTQALPNFHTARDNRRTRPAIIINVAWALVLQQILHQSCSGNEKADIVFGNVTTGRNGGGMPNLDAVIGPCVNMLPTRVQVPNMPKSEEWEAQKSRRRILRGLVEAVAQQVDDRSEFEGLDWDDVVRNCTVWPKDTRYASAVHFRNMAFEPKITFRSGDGEQSSADTISVVWYELVAKPHWTTVLCYPENDVLRLWLLADPDEISDEGADELLRRLTAFVLELVEILDSDERGE